MSREYTFLHYSGDSFEFNISCLPDEASCIKPIHKEIHTQSFFFLTFFVLIKPIFSQFIQQVSVSKHVYDARARVDEEEELKSLVALFSGNHGSSCIAADINNLYPPLVSRKEK